jgi:hypothetical protein
MRLDIKTTLIIALAIAVAVLSTCRSCEQKRYEKKIAELQSDNFGLEHAGLTEIERDTITEYITDSVVIEKPTLISEVRVDSFIQFEQLPSDTGAIAAIYLRRMKDMQDKFNKQLTPFLTLKNYQDTLRFKNGNGYVVTKSAVHRNNLVRQTIISDSIPQTTITNTITNTVQRAQLFLGIDAYGEGTKLSGAGFSAMFKSKRALAYEYGAWFDWKNQINHRLSIKFPLKLKNN